MLIKLSEKNLNYNSIEYIKSSIEHWCKYYVVDQNIKKSLIWSSYTNSERIVNIIMFYKCINEDSNMDKAFFRLSMFYYRENKFKKAKQYIEKAIKLNQEKSKYWKIYLNCLSKTSTKNY